MVKHLQVMDIAPVAEHHAKHGIPLAGRLKHFFRKLACDHARSMGARSDSGVHHTIHSWVAATMPPVASSPVGETNEWQIQGMLQIRSLTPGEGFHIKYVPRPEEKTVVRDLWSTWNNWTNMSRRNISRRHPCFQGPTKSRRLGGEGGPNGCIFHGPDQGKGQTSSNSSSRRATIVLVTPVWTSQIWYPKLLSRLVQFSLRILSWRDTIIQVAPRSELEVVSQIMIPRSKHFNRRHRAAVGIWETKIFTVLQLTLLKVGMLVWPTAFWSCFRACKWSCELFGTSVQWGLPVQIPQCIKVSHIFDPWKSWQLQSGATSARILVIERGV